MLMLAGCASPDNDLSRPAKNAGQMMPAAPNAAPAPPTQQAGSGYINVLPEDALCKSDSDCTVMKTDCSSCTCSGQMQGVNTTSVQKLSKLLEETCRGGEQEFEACGCRSPDAVCKSGHCEADWK